MIVLFNSGVGTMFRPLVEMWLPTVAQLLGLDADACTCFSRDEAAGEELLFRDAFAARLLVPSQENPFAYVTPHDVVGPLAVRPLRVSQEEPSTPRRTRPARCIESGAAAG